MSSRRTETEELLEELVLVWTETYKKSMTTLIVLRVIARRGTASVGAIAEEFGTSTGWDLTERGLYRTVRRLTRAGLLTTQEVSVPKTGAKRKDFGLTALGRQYLARLEEQVSLSRSSHRPGLDL